MRRGVGAQLCRSPARYSSPVPTAAGLPMCLTPIVDLSDFRVLSFDCYGTMIDWETGILANIRRWLDVQGVEVDDAEILEAFGRVEAAEEASTPDALYPNILTRVHDRLGAIWNLDPDPIAAARFSGSVGSWPPFSDSHDALTKLGRQYRLVILSNVDLKSFAASRAQLDIESTPFTPPRRSAPTSLTQPTSIICSRQNGLRVMTWQRFSMWDRACSTITFQPPMLVSPPAGYSDLLPQGNAGQHNHPQPCQGWISTSQPSQNSPRRQGTRSSNYRYYWR